LTQISPATGPAGGGTLVTLTGSNFVSGLSVRFADVAASAVNFSNSTLVTVTAPPNASGLADVTLINPDGQWSTLSGGFTYTGGSNPPPSAPSVSLSVAAGNLVLVSVGATNGTFQILSSADAAAPVSTWTSVVTNSVGPDGLFTNTLPFAPGEAQRYYRLVIP
jgi:hypothetical protein